MRYILSFILFCLMILLTGSSGTGRINYFFPLAVLLVISVFILYYYELQDEESEDDVVIYEDDETDESDENSCLLQGPGTLKIDARDYSVWKKNKITFYKDDYEIAWWIRDRFGNVIRKNGKKIEGRIYNYYTDREGKTFYSRISYEDNKIKDGTVRWVRGNESIYSETYYKDEKLMGIYRNYYKNRMVRKTGILINGRPEGEFKWNYDSGAVMKTVTYTGGVRNRGYKIFYEDGILKEEGEYIKGKITGQVKKYYNDGLLKADVLYRCGKVVVNTEYDAAGNVTNETLFLTRREKGKYAEEYKDLIRRDKVKKKLYKYGLKLYDPVSPNFPRIRAITKMDEKNILKEFSCEEELINWCLKKENFKSLIDKLKVEEEGERIIAHFNKDDVMVRGFYVGGKIKRREYYKKGKLIKRRKYGREGKLK